MVSPESGSIDPIEELGRDAGFNARNPLEEYSKAFGDVVDQDRREQFLNAYLEGVTKFFEDKELVMPIGSHMDHIISPQGLIGFTKGLNREVPSKKTPRIKDDSEGAAWEYTLDLISDHFYREGYFIGFMVGLARDHDLKLAQVEVPKDASQFELFNKGKNAQSRIFSPWMRANFALEGDQQMGIRLENWIYEGGLKLWLKEQGFDVNLARKISHPEALDGFLMALKGIEITDQENSEAPESIGYRLGQIAREELGEKES